MRFTRVMNSGVADEPARTLYAQIVAQARRAEFYTACGVPDTLDGRFEMVALHAFLVLHRLKKLDAGALAQALFDTMFMDMDENLREIGVGDLSVGKRVKQMVSAFYGRVAAYETGLAGEAGALEAALARNLYGTVEAGPARLERMAAYLRREALALEAQDATAIASGTVSFGPPPGAGEDRKEMAS
ncbi:MAG: ubiquinol-cytochrome C chaperone family protein [Alphaproteobacteria bacterium]|nr:ubiquinol-cytochrome C chaperone family protein [Alphaproteobacteria bacterium]